MPDGVEPGGHGEAGGGQSGGDVALHHEVVVHDLLAGGPPLGVPLQQPLDEQLGAGGHAGGHPVLVALDAHVGVLERLCLEGRLAHQQREQDAPDGPHVNLTGVTNTLMHGTNTSEHLYQILHVQIYQILHVQIYQILYIKLYQILYIKFYY